MLSSFIRFSLVQRLMILLFGISVIGIGLWSFQKLPIDAFPDISSPQVLVIVKAPGMSPTEVEQRITVPIELEMQGIPKQQIMRSTTKYALSIVTMDFEDDTDIYWARQQVTERLNQIWNDLPSGVEGGLAPITTPLGEIYMYQVKGDKYDNKELRRIQDWIIRPALRTVQGVADVNSLGGEVQAYEVVVKPELLVEHGLSIDEVEQVLQQNNRNAGGDRINKDDEVILIRTVGQLRNIDDIDNITVKTYAGQPIKIRDIAEVKMSSLTRYGGVTAHGQGEVVTGLALLRKGENSRTTVDGIKKALEDVKKTLPEGVSIVPFYDRSDLVKEAVGTVKTALGEAIVLVFIVLIIMLGNLRSALVVSLVLPLAVLLTFFLMKIFNISANLMSLGGIAIAIGILVDSSIVIVENIHTQLSQAPKGVSKLHLIYRATMEVAVPVIAGVAIIIVVFLPLFSLTGLEGKMFTPLAVTISFAMAGALFLSLTVIPVLASLIMREGHAGEAKLLTFLKKIYRPVVGWALKQRLMAVGIAVAMLIGAGCLFPLIGKEFMPLMDEGSTIIIIEKTPTITLEKSLALDEFYQKAMMEIPEVTGVVSRTGADELRLDPMDLYQTDNFILTKPRSEWSMHPKEMEGKLREKLAKFEGINIAFTQPIDMRVSEMLTGVRAAIAIKIFGDDMSMLEEKGMEIERLVKSIKGAIDVFSTKLSGQKYLQIEIIPEAIAKYGINVEDINQIVEVAVGGRVVTEVIEKDRRIDVLLRYPEEARTTLKAVSTLLVKTPSGNKVPLNLLAKIKEADGPFQIERESNKRQVIVQANVTGRDVVSFVDEIQDKIEREIKLPKGWFITYGGQFENQQRAAKRLALVVPISIALIFLLLFTTFRSTRQAFLIILNIPFALIGGIVSLYISGLYLSVPASVGFIALFGVAIMNGVVMVSYFNQLRALDYDILTAVKEGAERRLRPVLMTASIAILGLVPLLMAQGPGSELQRPLAVVVIGGTITSTLLTLILLPTLYAWVEGKISKARK